MAVTAVASGSNMVMSSSTVDTVVSSVVMERTSASTCIAPVSATERTTESTAAVAFLVAACA